MNNLNNLAADQLEFEDDDDEPPQRATPPSSKMGQYNTLASNDSTGMKRVTPPTTVEVLDKKVEQAKLKSYSPKKEETKEPARILSVS